MRHVKKVKRWSCKLCGEKQSLLKEFGCGSGPDCRQHVQKLNAMRGAMMEEQDANTWSLWEQVEVDGEQKTEEVSKNQVSRWSKYLDPPEEAEREEDEDDGVVMGRRQLHGNNMTDRKRKRADSWTPEQSACCSLKPVIPSNTTSPLSKKSVNLFSVNQTSPPSLKAPVSGWCRFLSSDHQVREEGPSANLQLGGTDYMPCHDIITRPRPPRPVSSMFESGEDFSYSGEFLSDHRV
ncbi:MRN complex-interacting protein isoform X2 [Mastacembelus armatus]|uniref:MRN complex-interacting protein isoform X2 n=1 Tax=Mastacembelus armatus TaxID=205130 RepID=UPI000E4591F4|nr:MRN complex-interacting protein isoform X2 [Mastacembelus armatus]